MPQFKAIVPWVEVKGAAVLSFLEGMGGFRNRALLILERHGIPDPKEDKWYPQQAWLDAFKEISEHIGQATLEAIGKKIPDTAVWPPEVKSLEDSLASIDIAYHLNHRGGEIGHYRFEKTGGTSARIVCDNPYPCSFDLGIIKATATKFASGKVIPTVKHDDSHPCRRKGGNSCTYNITWM